MNKIQISYLETQIGRLIIGSYQNMLCLLDFSNRINRDKIDNRIKKILKKEFIENENNFLIDVKNQIKEYLNKDRNKFNLPILFLGSEFQKLVWKELLKIPYGKNISYSQLAKKINKPKAVRAVALANNANAISIIIPCHRVIGSNKKLCGYAGGINIKKELLILENCSDFI